MNGRASSQSKSVTAFSLQPHTTGMNMLTRTASWLAPAALFAVTLCAADPAAFGVAEFRKAVAARGLALPVPTTRVTPGKPECFTVSPAEVTGSDARGLMYGLLEAAEQVRNRGRLADCSGDPATSMRGIRYFLHNEDLEKTWYYSKDYWDEYFGLLARCRFNRFNLVFAHQTGYLAPPYPFWLALPEFPEIRAKHLSDAQRDRNLAMLQYISDAAARHGIDFTLGIWEHNAQQRPHKQEPSTEGLTRANIGPYSHAALKRILQLCPGITSVQMRVNEESGIPYEDRLEFYRDHVFTAIRDAGRPVWLDLRAWAVAKDMIAAAEQVGVPHRVSAKYWAEDVGRPYQPAETFPGYSYLNFLEQPRSHPFFWELWGLGSHRLLLWGDPQFVRRAAPTFHLGAGIGFEIDPPLAQKGFGNRPGVWGVFTEANQDRRFWKWEFERYWMFYALWGRLTYNPHESDSFVLAELGRRFGAAAPDVLDAYANASGVINEIVAAHLADPNMYVWPEINPGGLIDAYRDVIPSDWRCIASVSEAVDNRVRRVASAKQTPRDTAARLNGLARRAENAVARADRKLAADHAEWRSTRPDLQVLSFLARYHALKQTAVDQVTCFDVTGDSRALAAATRDLERALRVWERLVRLTDGLYPEEMAFGPDDVGHWKDKLPYVRHDLELVRERAALHRQFGRFAFAFDLGGAVKSQPDPANFSASRYVLANTVAPRFRAVDPATRYTDALGFGWVSDGPREAEEIPLTPYLEVRAVARHPANLPHDVLYRDAIRGHGRQVFRVKAADGVYTVRFLQPDRGEQRAQLRAREAHLDIPFPEGEWRVSGLVVQGEGTSQPRAPQTFALARPRPEMSHQAPTEVPAGRPMTVELRLAAPREVTAVRLWYRPVNQLAKFKLIENPADRLTFTIPGADISARWDLMYYFEILHRGGAGWFQPDPAVATPYYVVPVR